MQTIYAFSYNPAINTGTNTTNTVWRMAYQQPILLYKGTANTIKIVVFNNKQKVVDLSDYDVQIQIVDRETREHFVTKTASITAPTSGVADITFTEADLRNLQHRFYHIIARLMPPDDGSTVVSGEILYLDDNYGAFTPVTIEDAWNYNPTSISTTDGIPSISFTGIGETPDSFTGYNGYYVRVNSAGDALEFTSVASDINLLAVTTDIRPATNNALHLGNASNRWSSLSVANLTLTHSNIATSSGSDTLTFSVNNRHTFSYTDTSTNNLEYGVGSIFRFDDSSHGTGPSFQTWYGSLAHAYDPIGQHSLDVQASNANSYVELTSHDEDSYVGVDAQGPFIQTNWNSETNIKEWRWSSDGYMKLPASGKIFNHNGEVQLYFNDNNFDVILVDADGSTLHIHSFQQDGSLVLDGNMNPGVNGQYDLGRVDTRWNNLFMDGDIVADGITIGGEPYYAYLSLPDNANANIYTARLGNDNGNVSLSAMAQGGSAFEWTFGTDGSATFPGDVLAVGQLSEFGTVKTNYLSHTSSSTIQIGDGNISNGKTITVVDQRVRIIAAVPATSVGSSGDSIGSVAFDSNYMYYCTANYNGSSNIWKRVAWSGSTW